MEYEVSCFWKLELYVVFPKNVSPILRVSLTSLTKELHFLGLNSFLYVEFPTKGRLVTVSPPVSLP